MAALPTLVPQPMTGQGAYGKVPGIIQNPTSTYAQTGSVLPGLPNLTQTAGQDVQAQLNGQLAPGTVNFLQDKAAQFGVTMGMPGTGANSFGGNQFLRNLGLSSEGQTQQGLQNFNQLLPTLARTQIDPSLQFEVANQNAVNAAAPDPRQAAMQEQKTLMDYYDLANPSGGTSSYNEPGGSGFHSATAAPAWRKF